MKYVTVLVIPAILAAANPLSFRREAQPAAKAKLVATLRSNFCIDPTKSGCQEAIADCEKKPGNIEDCIRDTKPECAMPESSSCSKIVAKCADEAGKEEDNDKPFDNISQDVKDCIVGELIPAENVNDTNQPPETDTETQPDDEQEAAPNGSARPDQSPACKKASAEYLMALLDGNCNDIIDPGETDAGQENTDACRKADATFEKAWSDNKCGE